VLSECFARIFSVRVIACLTCRTYAAKKRPVTHQVEYNSNRLWVNTSLVTYHGDISKHKHTPPVAAGFRVSTGAEGADTAAATFSPETRDLQCCALAALGILTAEKNEHSGGRHQKDRNYTQCERNNQAQEICASANSKSRTVASKHSRTDRRERHGVRNC